jgi:Holliday junction resolvasome RuvABC ATP-dependent DNA helicase subunit
MTSVRPKLLNEYIGQKDVKSQMALFIKAAKKRGDALDHTLIYALSNCSKPHSSTLSSLNASCAMA